MAYARISGLGVATVVLLAGCADGSETSDVTGPTTHGSTSTTDLPATTIPLPPIDTGDDASESTPGSTSGDPDGTTLDSGTASGTDSGTTGSTDASSSSGEPMESTDGGPTVYEVEWCRLQYPPSVDVAVGEAFTVYVRLYVPELTPLSTGNDPAPELVVEMGYGVDGSNPATGMGAPWTWQPGTPNVGWDDAAEPNNDEYQGELSIGRAGIYDYAARISGDSGRSWVYCDLDDLLTGGYTPDQAGHAEVGQ